MERPNFCKIKDIKPVKHCYNIYGKIINVEHSKKLINSGEELNIADGFIGDETAKAHFRIIGKFANILQTGKVVSIRNGKSVVFDEQIRLEIDAFGKISEEPDIKINSVNNDNDISSVKYVKKEQNNN